MPVRRRRRRTSTSSLYYRDLTSWVRRSRKRKGKVGRRRRHTAGHAYIRYPCPNCRHTRAIDRKNPSAHNHHGRCSFRRYHKKYCRTHNCGCENLTRPRAKYGITTTTRRRRTTRSRYPTRRQRYIYPRYTTSRKR